MRLRYLRLAGLPLLHDLEIVFGHETVLNRRCAIRFVAGVNGVGKTRLLQALSETFLSLSRQELPPFPVTLAYDLGEDAQTRTLFLHRPADSRAQSALIDFGQRLPENVDWPALVAADWNQPPDTVPAPQSRFLGGDLPGAGAIQTFLPSSLLVYTSGALVSWQTLFATPTPVVDVDQLPLFDPDNLGENERPAGWDIWQEHAKMAETDADLPSSSLPFSGPQASSSGRLIDPQALFFGVCAVTMLQAIQEIGGDRSPDVLVQEIRDGREQGVTMSGLRGLLNEVGWLWPESLHLRLAFTPERWTRVQNQQVHALYQVASSVIRLPAPSNERLVNFDLWRLAPDGNGIYTAQALVEALAGEGTSAFALFDRLVELRQAGILSDLRMTIRKLDVDDLLLYEWLSDGERMFLGRMALFHLLRGRKDSLLILDEPETHFNDIWKRRIVDIIDDSLRDDASEVLISTHSSIALTDVFDTEITLLRRRPDADTVAVVRTPIQTFGALPSEIMREVFQADETVGQRATEFLDMLLVAAAHPDLLEAAWREEDVEKSEQFGALWDAVQELPHHYEDPSRLAHMLEGVRAYTRQNMEKVDISAADALEVLQERLGPGYYQFEFRRRLRALAQRGEDAASS